MSESKNSDSAEKAYAEAASDVKPAKATKLVESLKADAAENTPAKKPAAKKAPAKNVAAKKAAPAATETTEKKPVAKKAAAKKAAPKKKPVARKAAPAKKATPAKKPVAKKAPARKSAPKAAKKAPAAKSETTVTKLKEKIMATKNTDYTTVMTDTMADAVNEMQTRAQTAYDKGTASVAEMTELAKGNVEAMVESGKVLAEGMQSMGKTYADEAKTAYETATADLKEMASVKSPTELFQLQGKIFRRNFDAMVAAATKNTDHAVKLANDTMAPLSGRVNVAAEKLSKVA